MELTKSFLSYTFVAHAGRILKNAGMSLFMFFMKRTILRLVCWMFFAFQSINSHEILTADLVTFVSGGNTFSINFKGIVNPGNVADGVRGSVGYSFGMSEFEISERMIKLYNMDASNSESLIDLKQIHGDERPATNITWNQAARFVNWLNKLQEAGPAYWFRRPSSASAAAWLPPEPFSDSPEYDPANPMRSKLAVFALPTLDEWYKAAYFDPTLGPNGGYWQYATRSNTAPLPGTGPDEAVFGLGANGTPAEVHAAGGVSAYGVMGMNGNVWEWTETRLGVGSELDALRYFVGGGYADVDTTAFMKGTISFRDQSNVIPEGGFRVISLIHYSSAGDDGDGIVPLDSAPSSAVPEPGCGLALLLLSASAARRRWTPWLLLRSRSGG